jgi:hypothetical protein
MMWSVRKCEGPVGWVVIFTYMETRMVVLT